MPASQGAIYWPIEGANRSLLADPLRPPFGVNTLPRILLLHALEHSEQAEELLRVQWQLLQPGGKLLLIVPNRHGLWANFGHTPFTSGRAYGLAELKALLAETDFTLCDVTSALFAPPSERGFWLKLSRVFEWVGSIICPRHGGLLVIEAEKQIYAAVGERIRKPVAWASQQGAPA